MKKFLPLSLAVILVLALALSGCGGSNSSGPSAPAWPSPWQQQDVGTGMATGTASYSNGTFTISGSGTLSSTKDQYHYVYQTITGNFTMIVRVATMQGSGSLPMAGLIVRQSLANNSVEMFFSALPPYNQKLQLMMGGRDSGGTLYSAGLANNTTISDVPVYLKLVRIGALFQGYFSPDGTTWTPSDSNDTSNSMYNTFSMTDPVYAGMYTNSWNPALETATFDNVKITQP